MQESNHFSLQYISQQLKTTNFHIKIAAFTIKINVKAINSRPNNLMHNLVNKKCRKTVKATIFRSDIYHNNWKPQLFIQKLLLSRSKSMSKLSIQRSNNRIHNLVGNRCRKTGKQPFFTPIYIYIYHNIWKPLLFIKNSLLSPSKSM